MAGHRSSVARILLTMLAVGALGACGGSGPVTSTSPATSGSAATSSTATPQNSATTPVSPGGNKAIPELAGDTVSTAELYLQQVGLQVGQMLPRFNTNIASGLVITTSPYAGYVVPGGSPVDLLVSTGTAGCQGPTCPALNEDVLMPDVIGQTIQQMITTLALDDITFGSSVAEASTAAPGTVICTVPPPGERFPVTAPVDAGVSSGNPGSPPATLCSASTSPPPTSPTPPTSPSPPTSPTGPSQSPSFPPYPSLSP